MIDPMTETEITDLLAVILDSLSDVGIDADISSERHDGILKLQIRVDAKFSE